jgi:hypothetical protein
MLPSMKTELTESSRNYLTLPLAQYTRSLKYQSRDDSHILCRHVVIFCFVTGLDCHYSPLHFKLLTQIILVQFHFLQQHFQCHIQYYSCLTFLSVNTQPPSAPLRLFFCWLCYCVAISTVFQAYLTTFLIEPG